MSIPGEIRHITDKLSVKAVAADGPLPEDPPIDGSSPDQPTDSGPLGGARAYGGTASTRPASGDGVADEVADGVLDEAVADSAGGGSNAGRKRRDWGPIALYLITGLLAVLLLGAVGYGAVQVLGDSDQPSWQEQAQSIDGVHNYLATNPEWFEPSTNGNRRAGVLSYPTSPPVGGLVNPRWQNCVGDVYLAEIPKEQAAASMERGAVWITYRPDLPADQVEILARKVRNRDHLLISPYPELDQPISIQAWGYQLKVNSAADGRIDDFIAALRLNAGLEPRADCANGITDTGAVPLDLTAAGT